MSTDATLHLHSGPAPSHRTSPSNKYGLPALTPMSAVSTKHVASLTFRSSGWPNRPKLWGLPLIGHAYPTRQRLTSQHLRTIHRHGCLRWTAIIRPYARSE